MNQQSNPKPNKSSRRDMWLAAGVLLLSGLLGGCSRPGEENIQKKLIETYTCKDVEIVEIIRTDSMPGLYSYVGQYAFQFRFKEGEEGAKKYFKGLFAKMEMKGDKWEDWLEQDKVVEHMAEECEDAAQVALIRMADLVLPQMLEKKDTVRLPILIPMVGWSEFMPGRKGWDITMRRDKVEGEPVMSEPVKKDWLLAKIDDKAAARKSKKK